MVKLQGRNISVLFRISTVHMPVTGICRFLARISAKKLIMFAETFLVSVSALGECMDVSVYFAIILNHCLLLITQVCSFTKQ
jgi:hypothetical protein